MHYLISKHNKLNRLLTIGLAFMLTLNLYGCSDINVNNANSEFTKKNCPIFYYNLGNRYIQQLYFKDGVEDIPYISIEDGISLLSDFSKETYSYEKTGDVAKVTKKSNNYYVTFDNKNQTIEFWDYNCFYSSDETQPILSPNRNMLESELFSCKEASVINVYGDLATVDLSKYGISFYEKNDKLYLPLQTFADVFLTPYNVIINYADGEVYALRVSDYKDPLGGLSEIAKKYYAHSGKDRSKELIDFNYRELCLCLDLNYGLKSEHNISDFDSLFTNMGLDVEIINSDINSESKALETLTRGVFGDSHSRYLYTSHFVSDDYVMNEGTSVSKSITDYAANSRLYSRARKEAYKDGCPAYEEVGNTAYITLDRFSINLRNDYYENVASQDSLDTVEIISYANSRINRNNSPIKNVVLDLSNNAGGDIEAAIYALAWCMGEAPFYMTDSYTGASSTVSYRADINLDHEFDDRDQIDDKIIYCLISPVSFSCANMVPAVLKSSGRVSILGSRSGGGTSVVSAVSTADGNVLEISSTNIISILKNGSYYSVDEGVEPDFRIDKIENYYDRDKLTEYINNLY